MNGNDLKQVYGALLYSPGMNDQVKLDHKTSRKLVLLTCQAIERGLSAKNESGVGLIESVSEAELKDIRELSAAILEKAGLTEFYSKLSAFTLK